MDRIKLRVLRSIKGKGKRYDTFEVPYQSWSTVLDALLYVKSYQDHSLAIRYSCRMASCGSCGMMINGKPRLACYTKISELNASVITCEPLSNFPVIRDLVTNFNGFFEHHKDMMPYIVNAHVDRKMDDQSREFLQTPKQVEEYLQFSYCIKCGLCYAACPTTATDKEFPGPQALAQMYRYLIDNRDEATSKRLEIIDNRHGIWRCHFAGSCSLVCPKGVDPSLAIQLLRAYLLGSSKRDRVKPILYKPSQH